MNRVAATLVFSLVFFLAASSTAFAEEETSSDSPLSLKISARAKTLLPGEPLWLKLEILNSGDSLVGTIIARMGQFNGPDAHAVIVDTQSGAEKAVTSMMTVCYTGFNLAVAPEKTATVLGCVFKSGEDFVFNSPGHYRLYVRLNAIIVDTIAPVSATSNYVDVTVEKPDSHESAARQMWCGRVETLYELPDCGKTAGMDPSALEEWPTDSAYYRQLREFVPFDSLRMEYSDTPYGACAWYYYALSLPPRAPSGGLTRIGILKELVEKNPEFQLLPEAKLSLAEFYAFQGAYAEALQALAGISFEQLDSFDRERAKKQMAQCRTEMKKALQNAKPDPEVIRDTHAKPYPIP